MKQNEKAEREKEVQKLTKYDGKRNETSTPKEPNIKIIFIKKFEGIKFLLYDKYEESVRSFKRISRLVSVAVAAAVAKMKWNKSKNGLTLPSSSPF